MFICCSLARIGNYCMNELTKQTIGPEIELGTKHDIYDLQNYIAIHKREQLKELETKHYQCEHLYHHKYMY